LKYTNITNLEFSANRIKFTVGKYSTILYKFFNFFIIHDTG
jgi:hypothetical protein